MSNNPTEEAYRGARFARHPKDKPLRNCAEVLSISQPALIEGIHREYLEAGADIIETNTFNGTAISLGEFALDNHVEELNRAAVEIARRVADEFTLKTPGKPRFVAGSIGPTNKQLFTGPGRRPGRPQRDLRPDGGQLQGADPRPDRLRAWTSSCPRPRSIRWS